ncbi:hypothetical protein E2C01_026665 [Portunus trituberculatus]|uniref:Uncharacterized protein n=1 Tax=Portunus trituberculatus TaxID=210409 RepID=A0A5B7EG60_PORTR|nr:hypothetical protein [Portunus trituberculatus]
MECPHIAKFRPQSQHDLYSLIDHLVDSATLRDIFSNKCINQSINQSVLWGRIASKDVTESDSSKVAGFARNDVTHPGLGSADRRNCKQYLCPMVTYGKISP